MWQLQLVSESVAAKAHINSIEAIHIAKLPPKNITSEERQALRELDNDEDILILTADEAKATVVKNKADYDDKMQQSMYRPLERDPMHLWRTG